MSNHYGKHLILRVSGIANRKALRDESVVGTFIKDLVKNINMRILAGPVVGSESGEFGDNGCSAVIILYESHAAIHTYSDLGEAFIDVFSCKEFSEDLVFQTLTQFFGTFTVVERSCLDRGEHWEANVQKSAEKWKKMRKAA